MSIQSTSTWLSKYMNLAKQVSTWSKDPSKKIGAVAVGAHGQILSQGYNGFPRGMRDEKTRLDDRWIKYKFVVHAEQNCIYNASLNGVSLNGSDLYVYGLPVCNECAKGVIQVGIKRVFMCYPENLPSTWEESHTWTKRMFEESSVEYWSFKEDDVQEYISVQGSGTWPESICGANDQKRFDFT